MTPHLKTLLKQFDSLCETITRVLRVDESSTHTRKAKAKINRPVSRPAAKKPGKAA